MGKIMPDKLPLPVQRQVEDGVSILKQGGIVAFPTDTVYGLGAGANLRSAVERVYEVKKRPRNMALPLLLADTAQISEFAEPVPSVAWLLARTFLPGALTMILPASTTVADFITAGGSTVALRIPSHPVPLALIKGLRGPVVGTSANLSGKPSPLTAEEVYAQFGGSIDLVIDGGRCPGGVESTIVDLRGETPVVVREGAISREELRQVCAVI
jgi:L-threonylcarbamoyladenylate synthase